MLRRIIAWGRIWRGKAIGVGVHWLRRLSDIRPGRIAITLMLRILDNVSGVFGAPF